MPDEPKRHHVVPQFYLRGFAQDDKLATVRLSDGKRFSSVVKKAASETHFYRLVDDYENGPLALEHALGSVEDDASEIFRRIHSGVWPLKFEERQVLSFFIGAQLLRGPRYRNALLASGASGTNFDGSAMTAVDMHAHQIATLAEEWMPHLMDRPWDLVRFAEHSLITSDSPVSSIRPFDYDAKSWAGSPFAVAEEIIYPVTRKIGLLMNDKNLLSGVDRQLLVRLGAFDRDIPGSDSLEKRFNSATAATATTFLYHHPQDVTFVPSEVPARP
jgi:hypothetical protein